MHFFLMHFYAHFTALVKYRKRVLLYACGTKPGFCMHRVRAVTRRDSCSFCGANICLHIKEHMSKRYKKKKAIKICFGRYCMFLFP